MHLFLCLVPFLLLISCSASRHQSVAGASPSNMLEAALPAVVTVTIDDVASDGSRVFGYGRAGGGSGVQNEAYRRRLDLGRIYGAGSGFVVRYNNRPYIITNAHVVELATLAEGSLGVYSITQKRYPVRVVGGDSFYDVAVLEFDGLAAGEEFATMEFRTTPARIGERVYAIGNPGGKLPYTVTDGIISARNRIFEHAATDRYGYLQMTAEIFRGNSGGPLVDAAGSVVGINSLGQTHDEVQSTHYALDGEIARSVVEDIIEHGRVQRAYIGVEFAQLYQMCRECWNGIEPLDPTPVIAGIIPRSPAARVLADKTGWLVEALNGNAVHGVDDLLGALEAIRPGETIRLEITDGVRTETVSIPTAELDEAALEATARHVLATQHEVEPSMEYGRVSISMEVPIAEDEPEEDFEFEAVDLEGADDTAVGTTTFESSTGHDSEAPETRQITARITAIESFSNSPWRVESLAELGSALRLASLLGGYFVWLEFEGAEEYVLHTFDPDPDLRRRTVLY